MKVYIVREASWSDYRNILAVFTSEDEAKVFIAGAEAEIEEWETGTPEKFFQITWSVDLRLDDGSLVNEEVNMELHPRDWSSAGYGCLYPPMDTTVNGESVVSRDHALKVAAEQRQKMLREGI